MTVAFLLYGLEWESRNAFDEEKYQALAESFRAQGTEVRTVSYCDDNRARVEAELRRVDFTLVWINPIEAGMDRRQLDAMLTGLVAEGCRLSAEPATILKLGTKEILFDTAHLAWGSDVRKYSSAADFGARFPDSVQTSGPRVLKQYRGDGGKGVFRVEALGVDQFRVTSAADGAVVERSMEGLLALIGPFFSDGRPVLDQEWNADLVNGVVRCYLCGSKVVGFGYQEINMLYPLPVTAPSARRRNYYTENCGLFQDLRRLMETSIVPAILARYELNETSLPVLWDADCFLHGHGRYSLCEVNASCVSPFPESAIAFVCQEVHRRMHG